MAREDSIPVPRLLVRLSRLPVAKAARRPVAVAREDSIPAPRLLVRLSRFPVAKVVRTESIRADAKPQAVVSQVSAGSILKT